LASPQHQCADGGTEERKGGGQRHWRDDRIVAVTSDFDERKDSIDIEDGRLCDNDGVGLAVIMTVFDVPATAGRVPG
jgi:hypothetical protein